MLKPVTVTGPSTLVVPLSTEPVSVVSSFTLTFSSASVKGSSTGVTFSVRVAVALALPSLTV